METQTLDSGVTIKYAEKIPDTKQSPEFWATSHGYKTYATITKGNREIYVCCNGEMCLTIPNLDEHGNLTDEGAEIIRYGDELESVGIKDDIQFRQVLKTLGYAGWQVYRMNPWWEIFADHDPDGIVSDSDFHDTVEIAIKLLDDEDYWVTD